MKKVNSHRSGFRLRGLKDTPASPGDLSSRVTKIESDMSDVRQRLIRVETRLDNMDVHLDRIDTNLGRMDTRIDGLSRNLEQMSLDFRKDFNNLTLRLMTFVCGFGTTLVMATYFVASHIK